MPTGQSGDAIHEDTCSRATPAQPTIADITLDARPAMWAYEESQAAIKEYGYRGTKGIVELLTPLLMALEKLLRRLEELTEPVGDGQCLIPDEAVAWALIRTRDAVPLQLRRRVLQALRGVFGRQVPEDFRIALTVVKHVVCGLDPRDKAARSGSGEQDDWRAGDRFPSSIVPDLRDALVVLRRFVEHHTELAPERHGDDFRSVYWHGEHYSFTPVQAACVKILWEARDGGTREDGDATVIKRAGSALDSGKLYDLFRRHPAWGKMIIRGETKGTHRLGDPPLL